LKILKKIREHFAWKVSKEENKNFWNQFFASENHKEYIEEMHRLEEYFQQLRLKYEQDFTEAKETLLATTKTVDKVKYRILRKRARDTKERMFKLRQLIFSRRVEYKEKVRLE